MKIGILGGTFNPIHIGHLILADEVREKLNLDKVIFIPTYIPPHKQNSTVAEAAERLRMVKLAIKGNNCFGVSDIEILGIQPRIRMFGPGIQFNLVHINCRKK